MTRLTGLVGIFFLFLIFFKKKKLKTFFLEAPLGFGLPLSEPA